VVRTFSPFVILCAFAAVWPQDISFSVTSDRTSAMLGERIQVTAQIVSNKQLSGSFAPQVPKSEDFDVLGTNQNSSQSTNIQLINSKMTQSVSITYSFYYSIAPKKPGSFTFPALTTVIGGKTYTSNPFAISVGKDIKDKKALSALYYNLGNSLYMQGEQLSAQNNQQAMDKYKGALESYIKSLDAQPSDRDAKRNVQLVQKKIKQMQQQQQQQQNNKDNKQNKDNKNQNDQKNRDDQEKKNQDQNKQDQNKNQQNKNQQEKNNQQQNQQQDQNKNDQQKPEPTPQQQKQEDMKKDQAKRLIEQFSDDDKELNKKPQKIGIAGEKKVEKDW
jgi:flagellar biosynthesis GTPase FlhF